MKKKNLLVLTSLLLLSLSSCANPFDLISAANSTGTSTNTSTGTTSNYTIREVMNDAGMESAPATGNVKALVVPVNFADQATTYTSSTTQGKKILADLNTTFFGTAAQTGYWNSLASFYQTSSYGKMNISGTVTDFLNLSDTVSAAQSAIANKRTDVSSYTASIATKVYSQFIQSGTYKLSDYDSDNDGAIDLVWLVYTSSFSSKDSTSLLWAFTYWDSNCAGIKNYSWASTQFMYEGTDSVSGEVDAHTFIHETGHQLGLDDYYSYDSDKNPRAPLGGIDMMDYNIIDHCSFSKYDLGWITPTVAKAGQTYTLKPFESSGDCLLLADKFNGSVFDEYYLLEYYTPTGLNELDSKTAYTSSIRGFTTSGLRILHVDNRLGKLTYQKSQGAFTWDGKYVDNPTLINNSDTYYYPVSSNSKTYCYGSTNNALVSLVQATGSNDLMSTSLTADHVASNSDLFTPSSLVFGKTVFSSLTANEGWTLPGYVSITDMVDTGITVSIVSNTASSAA
jgi:M6 family metalloprotease-like protein